MKFYNFTNNVNMSNILHLIVILHIYLYNIHTLYKMNHYFIIALRKDVFLNTL
jgi:hypothetical protein